MNRGNNNSKGNGVLKRTIKNESRRPSSKAWKMKRSISGSRKYDHGIMITKWKARLKQETCTWTRQTQKKKWQIRESLLKSIERKKSEKWKFKGLKEKKPKRQDE
jgi:hypothetical protein